MSNAADRPASVPDAGPPPTEPSGRSPRAPLPPVLTRRQAIAVGSIVLVVTLALAASLLPSQGIGPGSSPATGASSPPTTASSPGTANPESPGAASATPGLPPGDWSALELAPAVRVAELIPADLDAGGLGLRSRFTLKSLDGTPAVELAKAVSTTPASQLRVTPGSTSDTAVLTPRSDLAVGTWYRFALRVDGAVAESWVYRTKEPLRVSNTIPGRQTTNVPIDTGIEITFNQDGAGDVSSFFSIRPNVAGTFERHGRAWVFVPEPLKPGTIYTVSVRKGLPVEGSDQVLEQDLELSFETAPKPAPTPQPLAPLGMEFPRDVVEVIPSDPPVVDVWIEQPGSDDTRSPLTKLDLNVYRLTTVEATVKAIRTLRDAPGWADWSDQGLVSTKNLAEIASFEARVQTAGEGTDARDFVEFPSRLEPGWYLVAHHSPAQDEQAVLEVTEVATFVAFSETKSLVWVNDVGSGGSIADAAIRDSEGIELARTDADGLATLVMPPGDLFLVTAPDAGPVDETLVQGRAAIVPADTGAPDDTADYYGFDSEPDDDNYWHLLHTDRTIFRTTDQIDAWGVVRRRDDGAIPTTLELRLSNSWTWEDLDDANCPTSGSPSSPTA